MFLACFLSFVLAGTFGLESIIKQTFSNSTQKPVDLERCRLLLLAQQIQYHYQTYYFEVEDIL